MDQTTLFELLECSVCMEVLDGTSKVLPCQHTFCRRCLDEIVATKKHLQCPECRMPVNKRVEDLPPNILLVRLLETMKTMAHLRGNSSRPATESRQTAGRHGVSRNYKLISKPSHPCAKALYNYDAQEIGDLTFRRGDVVRLCKQIDENWYLGEIGGQQGYFPATYVEVLVPLPDEVAACKALYDFIIDDGNEKDCLAFQKGEIITVLRRIDDNWAEGKLGDRIGIFPMSFVEMNDSAKCLIGHANPQSAKGLSSLASGQQVSAAATSKTSSSTSSSSFGALPSASGSANVVTDAIGSGHPLPLPTAATMQALKVPQTLSHRRPSVGVPTGSAELSGALTSASCVSTRNKPLPLIYEALYNYKPLKEDEIELKKGECYTVLQKCRDGWFKGRSLSTGLFGIFPGNYVKQIVLLPLDDLTLVQNSSVPSATPNHAPSSRNTSLGANRLQFISKGTVHSGRDLDGGPEVVTQTGASHRPRSRPITNITQAQMRNLGNAAMTTVAHSPKYLYQSGPGCLGTSSGLGSVCSPTWLNLMTTPNPSTDSGCVPTTSTRASGRRVQRSATCRARSASRMPLAAMTNCSSPIPDGLDSEDLRTMLRGLSLKEGSDLDMEYSSSNGACNAPVSETVASNSSFVSPADADKLDKRHGLMKRWTSVMAKGRKSSSPVVGTAMLEQSVGQNNNAIRTSAQEDRSTALSIDVSSSQKPVKVSVMKVSPISLSLAQSKSVSRDLYKCVTPYPAQNENELELKVGDVVYVVRKHDDGWFKGVLQRTGKMGLFPGNFVQNVGSS